MTADIRTAAQREAIQRAAHHEAKARYGVGRDPVIRRVGFEEGAVWGAARVTPTQSQIESVIMGRTATAGAKAVLALMAGLAEGEND